MIVTRIRYPAVIAGVLLVISFATRAQTNPQKARISDYPPECKSSASGSSPEYVASFPLKHADLIGDCEYDLAMLEDFASLVYEKPDRKGYMIYYGGQVRYPLGPMRRGEAGALAKAKLNHILFMKHLDPARFTMIDGGYREKWAMELWLVEKDGAVPVPTSTIRPADVIFGHGPVRAGAKSDCGEL